MQAHAKIWFVSVAVVALTGCAADVVDDAKKASPRTAGSGGYTQGAYAGYGSLNKAGAYSIAGGGGQAPGTGGTSSTGGGGAGGLVASGIAGGGASAGGAAQNGGTGGISSTAKAGAGPTEACPSLTVAKLPNGACTERVREYDIGATEPTNIVLGSDQRLWVDDNKGNQIIQVSKDGQAGVRIKCDEGSAPRALAAGKDDAVIWYTDSKAPSLVKVTKELQKEVTPLAFQASAIAINSSNELFLTEIGKAIYRVRPNQPVPTRWAASAYEAIVVDPNSKVWIASGGSVSQLDPAKGVTDFPLEEGYADNLTVGPDDALWATDGQGNRLRRVTLDGRMSSIINLPTGTGPSRIINGPDGALWFIEMAQSKIGRFSLKTGEITHYPIPTVNGMPYALTVGPDKNIWFTETSSHKVGRLIPDPVQ